MGALSYGAVLRIFVLLQCVYSMRLHAQSSCRTVGRTMHCTHVFPETVPTSVCVVVVHSLKHSPVKEEMFAGPGWGHVSNIVINGANLIAKRFTFRFTNSCFQRLANLENLHIHVTPSKFDAGIFTGLGKVTTLDLSRCTTLSKTELLSSMKSPKVLPNLKIIKLNGAFGRNIDGNEMMSFDSEFWNLIGSRPVVHADLSNVNVQMFNLTAFAMNCKHLDTLLMRRTSIMSPIFVNNTLALTFPASKKCPNLRKVDVSNQHGVLAEFCQALMKGSAVIATLLRTITKHFWIFSNAQVVIANFVCRDFQNLQIKSEKQLVIDTSQWNLTSLHLDGNNLKLIDLDINCVVQSNIEFLSLKQNGMEYIEPSFFACLRNLRRLFLSNNNLDAMVVNNSAQFVQLFRSLDNLTMIDLAKNRFKYLPDNVFTNNSKLRYIDLASNFLEHFHVNVTHMPNLTTLNLASNRLKVLDHVFMSIVKMSANTVNIKLTENPLLCGSCDHYEFIKMILSNRRFEKIRKGFTCQRELGQFVDIDSEVERELKGDCNNRTREQENAADSAGKHSKYLDGIYTGIAFVALLSMVTASACATRKCLEVIRQRRHLNEMQELIREGQERFHFVVFLAFCNQDRRFVAEQVVPPLQECLAKKTGAVRKLVCVGDTDILPNELLLGGLARLMEQSNVVVVILTKALCRDHMRAVELNEVCLKNRPIVFMVKEVVEDTDMHPLLRTVYKNSHKFFWKEDAQGDYALTTTWDHVGDVVLRLVK